MRKRLFTFVACVGVQGAAWGLDAQSQKLADRYLTILVANPMQQTAFDRLWKIHAEAGEVEALVAACQQKAGQAPVLYARVLQRAGRTAEAKQILTEAVQSGSAVATEMLAALLEEEGDIRAAAELVAKAPATEKNPSLLVRLGELLEKAGEPGPARDAWNRAVALYPGDLALRKRLAAACAQTGNWQEAVDHLQVIARHGTPTERFSAWSEISQRFEAAGKISEAIVAQEALLGSMGPGHWQLDSARQRLLNLHDQNHSLDTLEETWRAHAEASPRDPQLALRMAKLYEFKGDDLQRHDWLSRASALLPKEVGLSCEIAALDLSLGQPEAAANRYDKALAMRPDDADIIFRRAEVSALMEQEEEAERRIEAYLAGHRDDEAAAARAIEFYQRLHLTAPLERKLSAAFRAHPDNLEAACDLARFYLEQRRDAEAAACLSRFDGSRLGPTEAAAASFRFAELLKGSEAREEEIRWVRQALEKDASRPEYALRLADLLQAEGQPEAMLEVLRQACEASNTSLPREDLDRRLFLALQTTKPATSEERDGIAKSPIDEMIASLDAQAQTSGHEAPWLRLARWLRWADSRSSPVSALHRGLDALPQSIALQEALAVHLGDSGDPAAAIEALTRLAELAPERTDEIQRRIGHLKLDRGDTEEGLRIFQGLADRSKDWRAFADVALAQQMGGNWFDAFETWQRAYALAPPDGRRSLRTPILNAATRLQLFSRGLDFLEETCTTEGGGPGRKELFDEAGSYAVEHGVADDWRARIERRARSSPSDRLWRECLASLLTAEGNEEEALRVLKTVSSRESEESIEDTERLIKLAEKAADWDEAARLARRIVLLSGANDVPASIRQADYLERAGRRKEAENVWKTLASRHGRDPQVLSASGDFFERTGDPARAEDAYRTAARFRGCAPQVRLRLGQLALDRGDHSQARADFEMLLRETRSQLDSYQDCIPVPERIAQAPVPASRTAGARPIQWKAPLEADAQGCRLLAIRELGRLLSLSPGKKAWIEEFSEPIEKIWAAYHAGEETAAFLEIETLAHSEDAAPALEQGFAALAMENSAEEVLRRWASDAPEAQAKWENILAALSRMLAANWLPVNDSLTRLFAQAPALIRWQAAEALSNKNLFSAACALGESVPDALPPSQSCSAWIELSKWWIVLCNPDEAIVRLDKAIESAPSAISFGEPLFAAIRARWLLTPENQKASFEDELSARLRASKQPKCENAAAALVSSLKGDHRAAGEKLGKIFEDMGSSDDESWSQLVQQGGNQLEDWNLHRLARQLYRNDLARDSALLSLRGENFRDATVNRFVLNQLIAADTEEIPYLLNEWLARGASDRELLDAVVRLQHAGRVRAAAIIYRALCDRNPRNEGIRSGILNLIQVRLLQEAGIAYFERLLTEEYPGLGRAIIQTAGLRLVSVLDEEGDYSRALALLERLGRDGPLNKALLLRHVQTLCKVGRHREALAELEKSPFLAASSEFTIPMAELYAGLGREREAFTLLERDVRSGPPRRKAATAKLREMARQTGDEAHLDMPESPPAEEPPAGETTPVSEREWEKALTEVEHPSSSPEERFRALRSFLSAQRALPENLKTAQLARLKRMVAKNPGLLPEYYGLRRELAERSNATNSLLLELYSEWNGGRGPSQAGEMIVQILLQKNRYEAAGVVLNEYLTETHFNERAWDQIGHRLLDARQYSLAARTFSELTQRVPGNLARSLMLAQALHGTGKAAQADAIVAPIKRIAPFDPSKNVDIAEFYLATERLVEAQPYLAAAPPDARAGAAWIHAAELSATQGNFAAAGDFIRQAMNTPQVVPARAIADFYWKSGTLSRRDPRANEFELGARQFRGLQIEVAQKLVAANDIERAWSWIEGTRSLLNDAQGRSLLQSVESSDWDRAAALWESSESPLWDTRCGMAQFYLRRAEAGSQSPAAAMKDLARAHELHPGSFAIAQVYVNKLLESDEQETARQVLQQVIEAYSEPADRRAARQLLASLELSPALPKGD